MSKRHSIQNLKDATF